MTVEEIKEAVNLNLNVYWTNKGYQVIKDRLNQYHIICLDNQDSVGLTHKDNTTLNGKEEEFFIIY